MPPIPFSAFRPSLSDGRKPFFGTPDSYYPMTAIPCPASSDSHIRLPQSQFSRHSDLWFTTPRDPQWSAVKILLSHQLPTKQPVVCGVNRHLTTVNISISNVNQFPAPHPVLLLPSHHDLLHSISCGSNLPNLHPPNRNASQIIFIDTHRYTNIGFYLEITKK